MRNQGVLHVDTQVVVHALLGRAGIGKTLTNCSPDELERVLVAAREFDCDDTDADDPGPYQLHWHAEHWQRLHPTRGPGA